MNKNQYRLKPLFRVIHTQPSPAKSQHNFLHAIDLLACKLTSAETEGTAFPQTLNITRKDCSISKAVK